jgi:uncharacterized protein YciI
VAYLYVLNLVPRLRAESAWTDADRATVNAHFQHLSRATERGQVVLAGRTDESMDKRFGLVIFEAESEEAALAFMQSDPAVAGGVMTATLHPYSIALQRK